MKTTKETSTVFAANLKAAREAQGYSQTQLGIMTGVSQQYVWNLENSRGGCNLSTAIRFADALGVSLDDLTGRDMTALAAERNRRVELLAQIAELQAQL